MRITIKIIDLHIFILGETSGNLTSDRSTSDFYRVSIILSIYTKSIFFRNKGYF